MYELFELKQEYGRQEYGRKYLNENIKSLCARLSIFYHEFMMDTESNSENLHTDWKFQLDLTDLETVIQKYFCFYINLKYPCEILFCF